MKYKTLYDPKQKIFGVIIHEFDNIVIGTSSTPDIFPITATKEGIIRYYHGKINLDDLELIDIEITGEFEIK